MLYHNFVIFRKASVHSFKLTFYFAAFKIIFVRCQSGCEEHGTSEHYKKYCRVPRSCSGSVQMKSNMTFIRGNRCIEREKDNFKSREVKCLNGCALALT